MQSQKDEEGVEPLGSPKPNGLHPPAPTEGVPVAPLELAEALVAESTATPETPPPTPGKDEAEAPTEAPVEPAAPPPTPVVAAREPVSPVSEKGVSMAEPWAHLELKEKPLAELCLHLTNGMNSAQTSVHMGGCNLTPVHLALLRELLIEAGALREHPTFTPRVTPYMTLQSLNVEANKLGVEGARHLAAVLRGNRVLQTVKVGRNWLGAEGAAVIAEALRDNNTLTHLILGGNDIQAEGAVALAEALCHNKGLKMVRMGGNNIGDEGAMAMAGLLRRNRTLTCLHLYQNEISEEGIGELLEVLLWGNATIHVLNLGGNLAQNGGQQIDKMNSMIRDVNRLGKVNRLVDFRIRLMLSLLLVHVGGQEVEQEEEKPCIWGNLTGREMGLFRHFLDLGLRRFYNDLLDAEEAAIQNKAGAVVLPEHMRIFHT